MAIIVLHNFYKDLFNYHIDCAALASQSIPCAVENEKPRGSIEANRIGWDVDVGQECEQVHGLTPLRHSLTCCDCRTERDEIRNFFTRFGEQEPQSSLPLDPKGASGDGCIWNLEMSTVGMGEGSDSWKNLVLLGNIFGPNRAVGMGRIKTYDTMFSGISQGLARLEAQLWSWVDPLSQRFTTRLNWITDLLEHGARNHHAWHWAKDRPRTALPKKNAKQ